MKKSEKAHRVFEISCWIMSASFGALAVQTFFVIWIGGWRIFFTLLATFLFSTIFAMFASYVEDKFKDE